MTQPTITPDAPITITPIRDVPVAANTHVAVLEGGNDEPIAGVPQVPTVNS